MLLTLPEPRVGFVAGEHEYVDSEALDLRDNEPVAFRSADFGFDDIKWLSGRSCAVYALIFSKVCDYYDVTAAPLGIAVSEYEFSEDEALALHVKHCEMRATL